MKATFTVLFFVFLTVVIYFVTIQPMKPHKTGYFADYVYHQQMKKGIVVFEWRPVK